MKILLLGAISCISLLLVSFSNIPIVNSDDNYSNNQLIIVAEDGYTNLSDDISDKYSNVDIRPLSSIEYVHNKDTYNEIFLITFDNISQSSLEKYKINFENEKHVKSVHFNYYDDLNYVPNDEKYEEQRFVVDMINLEDAWDVTTGSKDIIVGVIDTGIYTDHPDLIDQVDRNLSKSFSPISTNPLSDDIGHGTNVAGVIGASGNNTIGISGIAMNTTLVSLRVDNKYQKLEVSSVIEAINYANEIGIDILNYSAGGSSTNTLFREAIENYNGLFVCAAGNDSKNIDEDSIYPASYELPNLISVGSVNTSGELASFSNYGKNNVDILAPGTKVMTTSKYGTYYHVQGTSLSAPIVAGVAALMLSNEPTLSPSEIKTKLMNSVTKKSNLADYCSSGGIVNAYKSLQHTHNYAIYKWKNTKQHVAMCSCGETITSPHVVSSGAFDNGNLYAICLLCKGKAEMGLVHLDSTNKIASSRAGVLNSNMILPHLNIKMLKYIIRS